MEQVREIIAQEIPKSFSRKESINESDKVEEDFSSPTPVKTKGPSRIKSKKELIELPTKFGILLEFFDRMISSIRLLSLRGRTPSFQNISSQVETLTGRKFLHIHLAQIKHVLPEAVQIDKILIHDERTKCMKSDMKIELLLDVVKDHQDGSAFVGLSNLFSSRLRDLCTTHPEGDELPEADLPEPFNRKSATTKGGSISEESSAFFEKEIINSSHIPRSFKEHFCKKGIISETVVTDPVSPVKSTCDVNGGDMKTLSPLTGTSSAFNIDETTPVKGLAAIDSVHVETPVQSTPKRPVSSTEDENMTTNKNCMQPSSASAAKKSLNFYSMDDECTTFSQKQVSTCSPEIVLVIHQIFQSVNFGSITKEELVQKIIMNQFEIDDQCEVETQMEHLEKLAPDWFYKKLATGGDLLYNVNKVLDPKEVSERVSAA